MCLPTIFPVFMFAFIFFHCLSFSSCWPLAFLIFSRLHEIFFFFFQRNSSPLFSITRSSSFSVIHLGVNIKNNVEKDTTLFLFFSKSPGPSKLNLELDLGCYAYWLSCFLLVCLWCGRSGDRAIGRTYGHVATKISLMHRLPNFLTHGAGLRALRGPESFATTMYRKSERLYLTLVKSN